MNGAHLDAMYGLPPGTARAWARAGVISAEPTEHEYVAAYVERPALSAADHDRGVTAWAAQVQASLARAREAECQTTADPARTAAG